MNVCNRWVTHGFISENGSSGSYCGQPLFDGNLCRKHHEEDERANKAFTESMLKASRHQPGIGMANRGMNCRCGKFVKDGENHPYGLPARIEEEKRILGLKVCSACSYRWQHPHLNITCGAGCQDGWIPR